MEIYIRLSTSSTTVPWISPGLEKVEISLEDCMILFIELSDPLIELVPLSQQYDTMRKDSDRCLKKLTLSRSPLTL